MRALTLSGGGAKGSYQVGALKHLLGDHGIHYDIITGVSVGAINAVHLAQYPAGEELTAARELVSLWHGISTPTIYRKWYRGALWLLPALWKPSVYDSSPLHGFIRNHVKVSAIQSSGKRLVVGAVSKTTREYNTWTDKDADIIDGVLASSAFPGFLTPIAARGDVWQDGGSREITPIKDAILRGATHIDVLCCSPDPEPPAKNRLGHALDNAMLALDDAFSEIERNDIKVAELYNALIDAKSPAAFGKRRVTLRILRPTTPLLRNSLDFDPTKIRLNIQRGYDDARAAKWD